MKPQTEQNNSVSTAGRFYKNMVILSDFNCDVANAQIEMRFQNVFRHTRSAVAGDGESKFPECIKTAKWIKEEYLTSPPAVTSVSNIPFGNIDFAAYAVYAAYRALGKNTRPNIFIHVTDPGVGGGEDRSILVTDEHNVFVGPNNGSLSMMAAYFDARGISYKLFPISHKLIEQVEQTRTFSPSYIMPETFHGRDLFAVTAGLIAGGVSPESLKSKRASFPVTMRNFASNTKHLPTTVGKVRRMSVFRDNTFGNLKTNLSIDAEAFRTLVNDNAVFKVSPVNKSKWLPSFLSRKINFPVRNVFSQMGEGSPLLYLGSTFAVNWDERFVELAVNMGNAGDRLNVHPMVATEYFIERIV